MPTTTELDPMMANLMDFYHLLADFSPAKVTLHGKGSLRNVIGWSPDLHASVIFGSVKSRISKTQLKQTLLELMQQEQTQLDDAVAEKGYETVLAKAKLDAKQGGQVGHYAQGWVHALESEQARRNRDNPQTSDQQEASASQDTGQNTKQAAKQGAKQDSEWVFHVPALAAIQGGRIYYAVTMPYRVLARLLQLQSGFAVIERAQREVNKSRVSDLMDYMGLTGYTLPALTGCVEGKADFTGDKGVGMLAIDMGAKILLADGQHRASAIVAKVEQDAAFASESVIIQLYTQLTLPQRQQLFSDLNSKAVKPNASINNLYNHRKDGSQVARAVADAVLPGLIDFERTSCGGRSEYLYPFKALIDANNLLMGKREGDVWSEEQKAFAIELWQQVIAQVPIPNPAVTANIPTTTPAIAALREESVLGTAVGLMVLAWVAKVALEQEGEPGLVRLRKVDWSKAWHGWQGNVLVNSNMAKSSASIREGARAVLHHIDLPVQGVR